MLRLITGKAGTGKTASVMQEIKSLAVRNIKNTVLIVPEQYGHEAERELAKACGDSLSLYAEVMSFTALTRKLMTLQGGLSVPYLDKAGKLLCMSLAMQNVSSKLETFRPSADKPEFQNTLVATMDEMKNAGISPEMLIEAALQCGDELAGKLNELALIRETYDAIISNGHADPADRMSVLADLIRESALGPDNHIFIDGFTDFTGAEHRVICELMKKNVNLSICLTLDCLDKGSEIFSLSRSSANRILDDAKECGCELWNGDGVDSRQDTVPMEACHAATIREYADNVFGFDGNMLEDDGSVQMFRADNMTAECEFAAAKILELVRETGCRWRDITVAARGFDSYKAILQRTFERYGVPLFITEKTELTAKPLPMLISYAYEITLNGWMPDAVLSYMCTGLTGLGPLEKDELGAYVFRWQLKEKSWKSRENWQQHPEGYGVEPSAKSKSALERINEARKKLSAPVLAFARANEKAGTAAEYSSVLADFLDKLNLDELLTKKAELLRSEGKTTEADEYLQLWDVTISALEQINALLGSMPMTAEQFSKLFKMMLSKYDIGIIPVSLDCVSAGEPDRMRKRNVKYLILLGAEDTRIPSACEETGIFSTDELETLYALGAAPGANPEDEIWREFSLIYNCLSLPSEGLIMCYPAVNSEGGETRESIIIKRAKKLFNRECGRTDNEENRLSAEKPALMLALDDTKKYHSAAEKYFKDEKPERLQQLERASRQERGSLSEASVEGLYGKKMKISASRADSFFSCRYAYFCNYGLKAKTFEPAEFSAPELGSFTHYVLQHTAEDVSTEGGFKVVPNERVEELVKNYIDRYIHDNLNDLNEKTERFRYLFRRAGDSILQIALDMAEELRKSDFVPVAFELNLSNRESFPPIRINEGGDSIGISGIVDRVDVWRNEGKAYLRVVDYKTGSKSFSLSDIWYGLSMQMLLYLYSLQYSGEAAKKVLKLNADEELLPAGVVYVPARNKLVSLDPDDEPEDIEKKRKKSIKRSGIVLNNAELIDAWENGDDKSFCPASMRKDGEPDGRSTMSEQQIEQLYAHIRTKLSEMACEIRNGSIEANPYEKSGSSICDRCSFSQNCRFVDGEKGESMRTEKSLKTNEFWELLGEERGRDE